MHTYSICFQLFPFKHRLIADKTVSFKILQLRFACPPTNEDMVIVDGHNRFRVCEKHGLPYKILMFSFADFLEARQWALDAQKGRRNLDKWELGKIALRLKPGIEARARENMSSGGGDQNSEGVKSGLTTLSDPIFLHFRHDCRKSTVQKTGSAMLPDPILLWTFDKIIRSPLDP